MRVDSGGNCVLSREYFKKLLVLMFYSWCNRSLISISYLAQPSFLDLFSWRRDLSLQVEEITLRGYQEVTSHPINSRDFHQC